MQITRLSTHRGEVTIRPTREDDASAYRISAIRLYLRNGFQVYGVEPEAIQHGGVYYDELLMARRISASGEG